MKVCCLPILFCLVASCASTASFRTKHGIVVILQRDDVQETPFNVEAVTDAVVYRLAEQSYWTVDKLTNLVWGLRVFVEPAPFPCPWGFEESLCSGICTEYTIRYVYQECPADNALGHELLHWLIGQAGIGSFDIGHERKNTWGGPDTVEGLAIKDVREAVCGQ